MMTVPKESARRYLVARQGLHRNRGWEGVLKAIESLEYVQVDPVRVVDTSHNLTLRNRVNDYRPELLAELLYTRRGAFEYWCSQRCILPMRDFPYFHYRMLHPDDFHSPFIESLKAMRVKFRANLEYVLSEIRKDGPLSASDLGRRGLISEKDAKRAMLMLWDSGEIMAHNVQGHGRIYDLTERLLPPSINMGNAVSLEEVRRFMLTKYFRSAGLGDTRDACRFGFWSMPAKERKMVSDELAHEGLVEEVRVEGVNATFYVPSDELQLLEGSIAVDDDVLLLAPLDNLLSNRRVISEIFGFDYVWEIYKIPSERRYGCYVMPLLHRDRFIGRLDPKMEREKGHMLINALYLERDTLGDIPVAGIARALDQFRLYHGASAITVSATDPAPLIDALRHVPI